MFLQTILLSLFVGFIITDYINDRNQTFVAIDSQLDEVKEVLAFAFDANTTNKETVLTHIYKHNGNQTIYHLEFRIDYYRQCDPNDTSVWVIKTPKGCKTSSNCDTDVIKTNSTETPYQSVSIHCVA
ncbi:uncharacterized protein LOC128955902 [Oppia nitens]|uniref:uncharacterized protein LOC128955902 n=1 Tax=Oppia nitens TaxID=1686743 RepID=UPI0023DC1AC4|nr:uncharacterized protein LOC128955902 [Oppia nitens]